MSPTRHLVVTYSSTTRHQLVSYLSPTRHLFVTYSSSTRHLLVTYSSPSRHLLVTYTSHTRHLLAIYSSHTRHHFVTYSSPTRHPLVTYSSPCIWGAVLGSQLFSTSAAPVTNIIHCDSSFLPYRKKDIDILERVQMRATTFIQKPWNISYEMRLKECGLTTLETRRLRGDQIEVFKILNVYENIDIIIFSRLRKREGLDDMELHYQRSSVD